ncbi:MAG: DsbE family thiol:disulfide interchange protein [Gammaproteobacteria bacterium]|nr:DsbE family thiol:disulfide interchange protein [Gammaproteobacteria bacterium]
MVRYLAPIIIFAALIGFFYLGLQKDPKLLPSALIGKPAPAFNLMRLFKPEEHFSPADMKGKVWILNVWASWCESCRYENPLFLQITKNSDVPIYGLNYKDKPEDAKRWLQQFGNPYSLIAVDSNGYVGIDFGVYGVPESFIIDKEGIIRYRHAGPVSREDWRTIFMPKIQELRG